MDVSQAKDARLEINKRLHNERREIDHLQNQDAMQRLIFASQEVKHSSCSPTHLISALTVTVGARHKGQILEAED